MINYIKLLRVKDWAKNLFLFLPSFFAGSLFDFSNIGLLLVGFLAFGLVSSCVYVINDYRDIEEDKNHPEKRNRPFPSGKIKKGKAPFICIALLAVGFFLSMIVDSSYKFFFILLLYFLINLAYCLKLKNISVLDILILSSGFVLRVKGGGIISDVSTSHWLIIMTFLLALFMAIAKRRDDILLKATTGKDMRKSISGYNLDFLNVVSGLLGAIIIVGYIMYTVDSVTLERLGTHRLYYTSLFVIAGILRYLQLTLVDQNTASPTKILYKDRFIQITLLLWVVSFYFIIYINNFTFFNK